MHKQKNIRSVWDSKQEKWYISVIDVIEVLTENANPRRYWSDLKIKLEKEGSQLSDFFGQLKLQSSDGKYYKTDVADAEQLFRPRSTSFATSYLQVRKLVFKTA